MIEPVHRDGASRILSWTRGGATLRTPLAFAADLPDAPAPAGRIVLSREPRVHERMRDAPSRWTGSIIGAFRGGPAT